MNLANKGPTKSQVLQESPRAVTTPSSKPSRPRGPVKRRFKGFDDSDDDNTVPAAAHNLNNSSHKASGSSAVQPKRTKVGFVTYILLVRLITLQTGDRDDSENNIQESA